MCPGVSRFFSPLVSIHGKPVCLKSLALPLYLYNLSGGRVIRGRETKEGGEMTEKEEGEKGGRGKRSQDLHLAQAHLLSPSRVP